MEKLTENLYSLGSKAVYWAPALTCLACGAVLANAIPVSEEPGLIKTNARCPCGTWTQGWSRRGRGYNGRPSEYAEFSLFRLETCGDCARPFETLERPGKHTWNKRSVCADCFTALKKASRWSVIKNGQIQDGLVGVSFTRANRALVELAARWRYQDRRHTAPWHERHQGMDDRYYTFKLNGRPQGFAYMEEV